MARILCVDKDRDYAGVIAGLLGAGGHECLCALEGRRACEMLEEGGIDLAVLEVMLPDVCGFEILRRIRASGRLFATPVMLVSRMSAEEEILHGLAQGADDYMAKPLDPPVFQARVKSLLQGAEGVALPDSLTQLMNERMAKCTVQHLISLNKPVALVCMELVNLAEFSRRAGPDAALKALRHAARILETCGKALRDETFQAAHMGAEHFMCLMRPESAPRFCEWVQQAWWQHLPALYESLGHASSDREAPRVGALVYYTVCAGRARRPLHECFQTLITIRAHAMRNGEGIYADRRAS